MKKIFGWMLRAVGVVLLLTVLVCSVRILKWAFGFSKGPSHIVRVVELNGVIMNSFPITKQFKEIEKDDSIKAVVFRINSPGGAVAPSQEIYEAAKKLDQKKPVIVSMGSVAASGGYYSALGGRTIFANPGTLTASIGVIVELGNVQKLLDWAKVQRFALKTGRYKDTGSPFRPMEPDEKELLLTMLQNTNMQFRGEVKARRKLSDQELERIADGRVVTGLQAKDAKLIDQLGTFEDAVTEAKKVAKLPADAEVEMEDDEKGVLKKWLFGDAESKLSHYGILGWLFPKEAETLSTLAQPPQGYRVLFLAPIQAESR